MSHDTVSTGSNSLFALSSSRQCLSPKELEDYDQIFYFKSSHWLGKDLSRMICLTICLLGPFAYIQTFPLGTPYLLSLGLSKALMSLVWLAGPLSGLIMQPVIGSLSDRCTSLLGRRRPFMIVGTMGVLFSLISIGWAVEMVLWMNGRREHAKYIAVIAFYILDFAVNTIQACCRALIVDALPPKFQEVGNAWAGRMIGLGNVFGYFMGYLDLVSYLPIFGDKQLKVLCVLANILLVFTVGVTCFTVREQQWIPNEFQHDESEDNIFNQTLKTFQNIFKSMMHMPKYIKRICYTQFFSWIGWFPFLFYTTTWVAELQARESEALLESMSSSNSTIVPHTSISSPPVAASDDLVGEATRSGSWAFVIFSIVSVVASFIVPVLLKPNNLNDLPNKYKTYFPSISQWFTISLSLFGCSMLFSYFISSVPAATFIIAFCGISWAVSMWAPFSLIGEFISEKQKSNLGFDPTSPPATGVHPSNSNANTEYHPLRIYNNDSNENNHDHEHNGENHNTSSNAVNHPSNTHPQDLPPRYSFSYDQPMIDVHSLIREHELDPENGATGLHDAGVILGIHNIFVVLPQFVISFLSSVIFAIIDSRASSDPSDINHDVPGLNGMSLILEIGGVASLVAAYLSISIWNSHSL